MYLNAVKYKDQGYLAPGSHAMELYQAKKWKELGYTENNVVWCLYYVNRMKNDLTYKEFIGLCHIITNTIPV